MSGPPRIIVSAGTQPGVGKVRRAALRGSAAQRRPASSVSAGLVTCALPSAATLRRCGMRRAAPTPDASRHPTRAQTAVAVGLLAAFRRAAARAARRALALPARAALTRAAPSRTQAARPARAGLQSRPRCVGFLRLQHILRTARPWLKRARAVARAADVRDGLQHEAATGRLSHNVDGWLMDQCAPETRRSGRRDGIRSRPRSLLPLQGRQCCVRGALRRRHGSGGG